VSLDSVHVPHVSPADRFAAVVLGRGRCKLTHLTVRVGYQDSLNVPEALALARKRGLLARNLDLENASYFLSRITISAGENGPMPPWQKALFLGMAHNAASPIDMFGLPDGRTVEMGSDVSL
ncbi:MAG: KUP/HAK/KT family potassium transporter, partial [Solirubrobacteraceae bacterium]